MISFPNAKINIGLNVVSKRPDGYHNLETIFYPIQLKDALEVVQSEVFSFQSTGLLIDGDKESNLVVKAYNLLNDKFDLPPVKVHLHKTIPFGAGLGGGSSDAAFMLKMLNELFILDLTTGQLEVYASKLGADCPFFINNKPVFAEGIGNEFSAIELDLRAYQIVIVKPPFSISTVEAYSNINPKASSFSLTGIASLSMVEWEKQINNDFEESVIKIHPKIAEIKDIFLQNGAVYSSMSGSGSAIFGIFRHLPTNFENLFPASYFIYR